MPGVAGFISTDKVVFDYDAIDKMLLVMQYRKDSVTSIYKNTNLKLALGCCCLNTIGPKQQPLYNLDKTLALVIDGEIYSNKLSNSDYGEIIAACENIEGIGFKNIKGQFSVAALDLVKKRIILVTDKLGQRPLYYAKLADGFAFASEIKALLTLNKIAKRPDKQALADCFHFGFVLGNKTLLSDVHLVPPASVLIYDIPSGKISHSIYWELLDLFQPAKVTSHSLNEIVEAFQNSVHIRMGNKDQLGISLSGGLDSRAILAAMGTESKGICSYTLGLPGCKDQIIASQLSSICGTKHAFLEISQNDLGNFDELANALVYYSDGMYHPHESTEKRALDYFSTSPFQVVLRGHGGEIAKAALAYPVQSNAAMCMNTSYDKGIEFIFKQAKLGLQDIDPHILFMDGFYPEVKDGAWSSINDSLLPAKNKINNADLCIYFYINEWIRRQVLASLSIFKSQVEVRLPYLDEDFLSKLLELPVHNRFNGEIQIEIVKQCAPKLVKVINSNTGSSLDAGKLKLFLSDKLSSVLKRTGLSGYRHYTEFHKWQREQFRNSIEEIIFSSISLDRRIYKREGLELIFQQHVTGKKQYGHLLGTIVAIELWHRLFID